MIFFIVVERSSNYFISCKSCFPSYRDPSGISSSILKFAAGATIVPNSERRISYNRPSLPATINHTRAMKAGNPKRSTQSCLLQMPNKNITKRSMNFQFSSFYFADGVSNAGTKPIYSFNGPSFIYYVVANQTSIILKHTDISALWAS